MSQGAAWQPSALPNFLLFRGTPNTYEAEADLADGNMPEGGRAMKKFVRFAAFNGVRVGAGEIKCFTTEKAARGWAVLRGYRDGEFRISVVDSRGKAIRR